MIKKLKVKSTSILSDSLEAIIQHRDKILRDQTLESLNSQPSKKKNQSYSNQTLTENLKDITFMIMKSKDLKFFRTLHL